MAFQIQNFYPASKVQRPWQRISSFQTTIQFALGLHSESKPRARTTSPSPTHANGPNNVASPTRLQSEQKASESNSPQGVLTLGMGAIAPQHSHRQASGPEQKRDQPSLNTLRPEKKDLYVGERPLSTKGTQFPENRRDLSPKSRGGNTPTS